MSEQFLTIKEAASMLGVSPLTLRNWDKSGKLKALRHPMNNYRVYKMEDLEKVLEDIKTGAPPKNIKKGGFTKVIVKHLTD